MALPETQLRSCLTAYGLHWWCFYVSISGACSYHATVYELQLLSFMLRWQGSLVTSRLVWYTSHHEATGHACMPLDTDSCRMSRPGYADRSYRSHWGANYSSTRRN